MSNPQADTAHPGRVTRRALLSLALLILLVGGLSSWWAGRHQNNLGQAIAAQAAPGDIRMLSSETCAICTVARHWFQQHQVAHGECFIERDLACREAFQALRAPGTPVILVRGTPLLGFDPVRVRAVLETSAR
jgi:hypothetical protein